MSAIVDQAILDAEALKPRRAYIGASSLGDECSRKIQYRYLDAPIDPDKKFPPKTLRIFSLGHIIEDEMVKLLRQAGFDLRVQDSKGKQFGFSIAACVQVMPAGLVAVKHPLAEGWSNSACALDRH